MAHFLFDEEEHRYVMMPGSRHVLSVTQVLDAVGISPDFSHLPLYYRERGRAIHAAMSLELLGKLDDSTLDERIIPFVERGRRWLDLLEVVPLVVEHRWCHRVLQYGGTCDLVCDSKLGLLVIDWKATADDPAYEIQVAGGYMPLLLEAAEEGAIAVAPGDLQKARLAVVTLGTEIPKTHWCSRHNAAGIDNAELFRAALAVAEWRRAYRRLDT